jgi:hypothetical protein
MKLIVRKNLECGAGGVDRKWGVLKGVGTKFHPFAESRAVL